MERIWYHKVTDLQQGDTVEKILKHVLGLTRKQISRVKFRENGICVDGCRQRATYRLRAGETLRVCLEEEKDSVQIEEMQGNLQVLYEDEDLIAVEKPSGQICHPSGGHYRDSLANQLAGYFRSRQGGCVIRIVGRLDSDTSGIVIAAKNQIAAQRLALQRKEGEFHKEYLALVCGNFPSESGEITGRIGVVQNHPLKMGICDGGKEAKTHYQVRSSAGEYSLVQCTLDTGRTHQIRVHMASIGHPLINDRLCGKGERDPFASLVESRKEIQGDRHKQLGLHAGRVRFRQPFTGKIIEIESVCEFADWLSML